MKIAVLGATGWIGSHITAEAKARGIEVVALVRDISRLAVDDVQARKFDMAADNAAIKDAVQGCDALIVSIGGRASGDHSIVAKSVARLLDALPGTDTQRLLWVGGAGSLEVAPGVQLISAPEFPEEYKGEALAQGEALDLFRSHGQGVNWTFLSPAAEIFPGDRLGTYRVGGDTLLVDSEGKSRISVGDYANALVDELQQGKHPQQRIGVAY